MSDLISRQEVIDRINKQREHLNPSEDFRDLIGDSAYKTCIEFIERLPSVQKTGKWIEPNGWKDWTPTRCSLCGHDFVEYVGGYEWEPTGDVPNYCPNCGATMVKEEQDG